jgi:hypothetical protein
MNYEGNLALSWQTLWVGPLLADSVLGPTSQTKESPTSQAAGNDVSGCLPQLLAHANRVCAGRSVVPAAGVGGARTRSGKRVSGRVIGV